MLARLEVSEIKQIAGRAGRYRTTNQDVKNDQDTPSDTVKTEAMPTNATQNQNEDTKNLGLVTTLDDTDLPVVQRAMRAEAEDLTTVRIFPPDQVIVRFARYFPPDTPLSYLLLRMHEMGRLNSRFQLCSLTDKVGIADVIEDIRGLSIQDRLLLCDSPAAYKDVELGGPDVLRAFARCVAQQGGGTLLDIPEVKLEVLDRNDLLTLGGLRHLEALHKALILYLWLSYRFAGVFGSQHLAQYTKRLVEEKINLALAALAAKMNIREKAKKARQQAILAGWVEDLNSANQAEGKGKLVQSFPESALALEDSQNDSTTMQQDDADNIAKFLLSDEASTEPDTTVQETDVNGPIEHHSRRESPPATVTVTQGNVDDLTESSSKDEDLVEPRNNSLLPSQEEEGRRSGLRDLTLEADDGVIEEYNQEVKSVEQARKGSVSPDQAFFLAIQGDEVRDELKSRSPAGRDATRLP